MREKLDPSKFLQSFETHHEAGPYYVIIRHNWLKSKSYRNWFLSISCFWLQSCVNLTSSFSSSARSKCRFFLSRESSSAIFCKFFLLIEFICCILNRFRVTMDDICDAGQLFELVFLFRKLSRRFGKFHICICLAKVGMHRYCRINMWRYYQRLSLSQCITLFHPGRFVKFVLKSF